MRDEDLRLAVYGVLLITVGAATFAGFIILAYKMEPEWRADILCWAPFEMLVLVVVGLGLLYIAFSKKYRQDSRNKKD